MTKSILLIFFQLLFYLVCNAQNKLEIWEVQGGLAVQQKFSIDEPIKTSIISSQAKSIAPLLKLSYDRLIKKNFFVGLAISFSKIVGSTTNSDSSFNSNFTTGIAPLVQFQTRISYLYTINKNTLFGRAGLGINRIFLPEASGRKITILKPPRTGDYLEIKDFIIKDGNNIKNWKPGVPIFIDVTFGYKYALGKHTNVGVSFGKIFTFTSIYNGVYEVKIGSDISKGNVYSNMNAVVYSFNFALYY